MNVNTLLLDLIKIESLSSNLKIINIFFNDIPKSCL